MKILMVTRLAYPHVGGVEKHIKCIEEKLKSKGHKVSIISQDNIKYPSFKLIGLLYIWYWFLKHQKFVRKFDIIHTHDVFIWTLPIRILFPRQVIISTIHGFEWDRPLRYISLFQKRIAVNFSNKSIGIGDFLEKYLHSRFNKISYGASKIIDIYNPKNDKNIVYVGRLEKNTGILKLLKWLKKHPNSKVDFCGDGDLRKACERYGTVHGFCDPNPFYKKAKLVIPGGYLAALEALNSNCDIKLFWNNKVKENYWKMSPFYKLKGEALKKWARKQTWEKLANEYLELYKEALNEKH